MILAGTTQRDTQCRDQFVDSKVSWYGHFQDHLKSVSVFHPNRSHPHDVGLLQRNGRRDFTQHSGIVVATDP